MYLKIYIICYIYNRVRTVIENLEVMEFLNGYFQVWKKSLKHTYYLYIIYL